MADEHEKDRDIPKVSPHLATLARDQYGDALTIRGYVGPSQDERFIVIYPSYGNLSVSIEVLKADILYSTEAPKSVLPNEGGMIVWLKRDAKITHRRTESVEIHKGRLKMRFRTRSQGPDTNLKPVCRSICRPCQSGSCIPSKCSTGVCFTPRTCYSICYPD